jgi:hypothetical protein
MTVNDLRRFCFQLKVDVRLGSAFTLHRDGLLSRKRVESKADGRTPDDESHDQAALDSEEEFTISGHDGITVTMGRPELQWLVLVGPATADHFEKVLKRRVPILFFASARMPGPGSKLGKHRLSEVEDVTIRLREQQIPVKTGRCRHCEGRFVGR